MKKKLKIAGFSFVVVIGILFVLPFVLPQSLYKNWFKSQIESALNIRLEVESFQLALLPLPSLTLKNVGIFSAKAPFENQLLAQSGEISAYVHLKPLMDKQVIASLSLEEPVLYFRASKDTSNFSNLLVKKKSDVGPTQWQLQVSSFELKKGALQYFPDAQANPKYALKNVDIALKNLSLAGKSSVPLAISMGVLGGEENFVLKGDVRLDLETKQLISDNLIWKLGRIAAQLKGSFDFEKMAADMSLKADVARLNGNTLAGDFPKIYEQVLHASPSEIPDFGDLWIDGTLQWSPKGLFTKGAMRAASVNYKNYPLENVRCNFAFSPPRLNISSLSAAVFGANASANNGFVLFVNPLVYQFDSHLKNVDLTRLAFLKKQVVGNGVLNASLQGKIAANKSPLRDLNATGNILVTEGAIPSLKLGEAIFGSSVWNILVPLAGFNKRALDNLKSLDATVEQLSIPFAIQGGTAKIVNGKWQNPRYQIRLSGDIGFDESLSGNGAFLLSAKETEALIGDAGVRKALANPQGELELPFNVSGTFENPKIDPDKKILTGQFTKVVAMRGIDFVKDQLNPENIAKDPVNVLEAPVKILKDIFGN